MNGFVSYRLNRQLKVIPFSIALRIPTAHDFRVISVHGRVQVQNVRDFPQS